MGEEWANRASDNESESASRAETTARPPGGYETDRQGTLTLLPTSTAQGIALFVGGLLQRMGSVNRRMRFVEDTLRIGTIDLVRGGLTRASALPRFAPIVSGVATTALRWVADISHAGRARCICWRSSCRWAVCSVCWGTSCSASRCELGLFRCVCVCPAHPLVADKRIAERELKPSAVH